MRLRPPVMDDHIWLLDAYRDWPMGDHGPLTQQKAIDWVRRWIYRASPICRVAEADSGPVGLIVYTVSFFVCYVHNLVIRPDFNRLGHARQLIRMVRNELVAEGVMVAEFDTLPGVIRDQLGTKYQDLGNGRGRLTWDMDI